MAEVTFIWYPLTSYLAVLYLLPSLPSRPLKEEEALFCVDRVDHVSVTVI